MLCKKCKMQNDETAVFCECCGTILQKEVELNSNENAAIDNKATQNIFDNTATNKLQIKITSHFTFIQKLVASLVVIVLVISASVFLLPQLKMLALTPQQYYALAEVSQFKSLFNEFADIAYSTRSKENTIKGTAKLETDIQGLPNGLNELLNSIIVNFCSINDSTKGLSDTKMTVDILNKTLGGLSLYKNAEQLAVSFPNIIEGEYLTNGVSDYTSSVQYGEKEFKEATGLNFSEFKKFISNLIQKVILNPIPKDNISKHGNGEYEGISCSTVAFKIDNKATTAMAQALVDELKKDDKIKNIISGSLDYYFKLRNLEPLGKDKVKTAVDGIINKLDKFIADSKEATDENGVLYTVFYNKTGEIVARILQPLSSTKKLYVDFATYKKDKVDIVKLDIANKTESYNKLSFIHKLKKNNKVITGSLDSEFTINDETITPLALIYNFEPEALYDGVPTFIGDIDFRINPKHLTKLSNNMENALDRINLVGVFDSNLNIKFNNKFTNTGTNGELGVALNLNGQKVSTKVAIEMLINNAANIEKRDISNATAFNKLDIDSIKKNVTSNVIKILGIG